jgi:arginyl-tRNA--protein-N-Asp/Glu arginylyltransferase
LRLPLAILKFDRVSFMQSREIVVLDEPQPCSYLPGRVAQLPFRQPVSRLLPEQFDQRLAEGDRRSGRYLYRPKCPACQACQAMRLQVARFRPSATQRRMKRRGDAALQVKIAKPVVDDERVRLFNLHRDGRGLAKDDTAIDANGYASFLTQTCCETIELSYWHTDRIVAVAIADLGREALSAVYCYYDPGFEELSLGVYSVLRQIALCQATGRKYLYLGFYIAESPHMAYKAAYRPHERLIAGAWCGFG